MTVCRTAPRPPSTVAGTAACADGLACIAPAIATSSVCVSQRRAAPAADDGVGERHRDRPRLWRRLRYCADNPAVMPPAIAPAACANNACAAPACDGVQNGTKTALDCGGDCYCAPASQCPAIAPAASANGACAARLR